MVSASRLPTVSSSSRRACVAVARGGRPWSRFRRRPAGVAALAVLVALFVTGLLAATIAPYPAGDEFLAFINKPQPPFSTPHHFLGTDVIGHDFLTQLLFGLRESVFSSLVCALGATLIGAVVGALAGYYGGVLDAFVTWLTGAVVSVPAVAFLLVIVIFRWPVTPFEFGLWLMIYFWTGVARVMRGSSSRCAPASTSRRHTPPAPPGRGSSSAIFVPNASGPLHRRRHGAHRAVDRHRRRP